MELELESVLARHLHQEIFHIIHTLKGFEGE